MNNQAKELIEITDKIKTFPDELDAITLSTNRKDEIGALAQSFNQMSTLIRDNMLSLEQAKAEAELANKEKEEFLENISHEIRNPLQSISGLSEVLENNNPLPHQDKIIKSLKFNVSNLHNLVNDILDYKRLLRGDITFNNDWDDLKDFLEELHRSNNYFAVTKKISFSLKLEPDLKDKEIFIDKVRLSQVINNLVVNAIKYNRPGGAVVLQASKQNTSGDQTVIRFSVFDNGIGIATDLIKKIKERYFTTHQKQAFKDSLTLE